jgi:hypothetical protein
VDYIDEAFMNGDAPQERKELYLQVQAIVNSFMAKIKADPLCDRHAVYEEMRAKVLAFLKEHDPNMCDTLTASVLESRATNYFSQLDYEHSGIADKALFLEFRAIVQPFIDKANADPWGDHSGIEAEMRVAMMPFLKKHNPGLL